MKIKRVENKIFFRIDKGEELVEQLKEICRVENVTLGSFSGIGATNKVVLGLFVTESKEYVSKEYTGDHEITSCVGNVTQKDGEVYLHLHANIADVSGNVNGGHLTSAVISATFDGIIDMADDKIERYFDEEIGLNLFKL